ncbi:MAG: glycoside hydrolase family 26 [Bacteroidetes bacterium]|nr:glycoside hydrolase family 26 [Bacteroidota bacterium]
MYKFLFSAFIFFGLFCSAQIKRPGIVTSQLKSIIYDFDGLNIGETDLPDGDYKNNDMSYSADASPLPYSDVIGDRVLKLNMNWQTGFGEFGKAAMRFIQLNAANDQINFYFYNPTSSSGNLSLQLVITEDDNQNNVYEPNADDKWISTVNIPQSSGWQLFSVPLNSMQDGNTGGNGIFDAGYIGSAGMIFSVGFILNKPVPSAVNDQFYIDMICFSEGACPHGPSILDLPAKDPSASCKLGALGNSSSQDQVPADIEGYLPPGKKLSFVNWFVYYSNSGTTANVIPGQEVQNLINNGYTPVITWEMMYAGYSRLDPVQPRLDKILNGYFDAYIDAFANKIKSYSGNVIMRIFHEFEGDWYSWSLTQNNADASKYIAAYHHVVDRFRSLGANNVQWMWCVNAEPKPYVAYNWIMSCYPGDTYVDIVATDIYNHPDLGTPPWKSFRYTIAETYYYLSTFVPNKPLYICEIACRERDAGEPGGSQTKGEWLCQMNRDLQTYFNKTKAMIFFSIIKEHDWRINSSPAAQQSFVNCVWNDAFYNGPVSVKEFETLSEMRVYPNPFSTEITFDSSYDTAKNIDIKIYDVSGKIVFIKHMDDLSEGIKTGSDLAPGIYFLEMKNSDFIKKCKLVKAGG